MRAILLLAVVLFLADGTMDIFQIATQRSTWGKHGSGLSFKNRARALGTQIIRGLHRFWHRLASRATLSEFSSRT